MKVKYSIKIRKTDSGIGRDPKIMEEIASKPQSLSTLQKKIRMAGYTINYGVYIYHKCPRGTGHDFWAVLGIIAPINSPLAENEKWLVNTERGSEIFIEKILGEIKANSAHAYNGWENWETWTVSLMIDNDEDLQSHFQRDWKNNFARKVKAGKFNIEKAVKAMKTYIGPKVKKEAKKLGETDLLENWKKIRWEEIVAILLEEIEYEMQEV